jgi:hypothetical protein
MKPPMTGVSVERTDCAPNRRLVPEAASGGGTRSIIHPWITGRTANRAKPSTEIPATKTVGLPTKVRAKTVSVVMVNPAMTTGRRPTRSEAIPAIGPAMVPPSCIAIKDAPRMTGLTCMSFAR